MMEGCVFAMEKIKQDLNIGKNIQKLRKERHLSQKDVTIQMNLRGRMISVSGYAHIEQGRQNLYVSDLMMLKEILDVSYEDFFKGLTPEKE
jgi:transcriptional regulator with XRE-family HTH domain